MYKARPQNGRKHWEKALIACIIRTPKIGKKVLRKS